MFALKIISYTGRAACVLLIAAGIAMTSILLLPQHREKSFDEQLRELGDHDYGVEARKLFSQKNLQEQSSLPIYITSTMTFQPLNRAAFLLP